MVTGSLLEGPGRMGVYSDLRMVFEGLGGRQREFDWLVTDLEWIVLDVSTDPPDLPARRGSIWISGEDLTNLVTRYRIQWVWAVLSGFRPEAVREIEVEALPYADGNEALWHPNPSIQLPDADVELVCWDGSALLLMSRDPDLTERFRNFFPEAKDLRSLDQYPGKQSHLA